MTENNIEQLNQNFSFQNENGSLCFKLGADNIPQVEIQNAQARALISLQGAHLLDWTLKNGEKIIWLSEDAVFAKGKSVRGGIPVCWPWFGAHDSNASYPAHGFARTVLWQVAETKSLPSGETQITFRLDSTLCDDVIQKMWPQSIVLDYVLSIGNTLTLELTTYNHSEQTIILGQALHTYFNVGDINHTTVYGLEGRDYLDKPDNFKHKTQSGSVRIDGEVDRIYLQTSDDVSIDNTKRKIIIQKQGSQSTIVWNPGKTVADKMGDLGEDGFMKMLCVESANVAEDTVTIEAGGQHTLRVSYDVT